MMTWGEQITFNNHLCYIFTFILALFNFLTIPYARLGKTIQTIAFVQAMFNMELISTVMLVMPLSLINNWQSEFEKWYV